MADWNCSSCGWVNREFSATCLSCGAPQTAAAPVGRQASPASPPAWDHAPQPQLTTHDPLPSVAAPPTRWFRVDGLLGGLTLAALAAVAASATWYGVVALSEYQIGFVAVAVGWVIGTGAVLGARRRGSLWLAGGSILLTLAALAVSEYLIAYHYATQELGLALDLIQPLDFMISVVLEVLAADPATLVFWGFAIAAAGWVPFKAIMASGDQNPRPDPEPIAVQ